MAILFICLALSIGQVCTDTGPEPPSVTLVVDSSAVPLDGATAQRGHFTAGYHLSPSLFEIVADLNYSSRWYEPATMTLHVTEDPDAIFADGTELGFVFPVPRPVE